LPLIVSFAIWSRLVQKLEIYVEVNPPLVVRDFYQHWLFVLFAIFVAIIGHCRQDEQKFRSS
jgi:hypothetical protein